MNPPATAQPHGPAGASLAFASLAEEMKEFLDHLLATVAGRARVASYPDLPAGLLALLARDEAFEVRRAVAQNPATPADVLHGLREEWACRFALGANPAAPPELLARLAQEWDPAIRRAVARNPAAPCAALCVLSRDSDARVRTAAAEKLGIREGVGRTSAGTGRHGAPRIAPRPWLSASVQGPLASGARTQARPPGRGGAHGGGGPDRRRRGTPSHHARHVWRHIARLLA